MAGLLPDMSVWGIIGYGTFFVTFSVVFTISSVVFQNLGQDVTSRWGR